MIKLLESFYKTFLKLSKSFIIKNLRTKGLIKTFQILSPALTFISYKNTIEVLLTSKKRCQAKSCLVDA